MKNVILVRNEAPQGYSPQVLEVQDDASDGDVPRAFDAQAYPLPGQGSDQDYAVKESVCIRTREEQWQDALRFKFSLYNAARFRYGLRDADAWDVVQQTYLTLHKRLEHGIAIDSMRAWLLAVLRSRIIDQRREAARHAGLQLHEQVVSVGSNDLCDLRWRIGDFERELTDVVEQQIFALLIKPALLEVPSIELVTQQELGRRLGCSRRTIINKQRALWAGLRAYVKAWRPDQEDD